MLSPIFEPFLARIWRNRPVRYLLLAGTLLVSAVLLGAAFMVSGFHDRALNDSTRELKNTALILSEQLDRSFQAVELVQDDIIAGMSSMGIASSHDYAGRMSGPDVHLMLKNKINGLVHVEVLTLVDADGNLVNFSKDWPVVSVNVADRDYFKTLRSNAAVSSTISMPIKSRIDGKWTVLHARKILAPSGMFLGAVVAAIQLSYFDKLFSSIVLEESGSIALYRSDGSLLTRYPAVESAIGKPFTAALDAMGNGDSGTASYTGKIEGKERLLAAHKLLHFPLHVSVAMDAEAALANWKKESKQLFGAAGLAASIIALIIFVIVRQQFRGAQLAQQRLETAINNMSQGLVLFDASDRIIVSNQQFLELYGLSPDVVKPGCTFRDLMQHRKETGSFSEDFGTYHSLLRSNLARGSTSEALAKLPGGRVVRVLKRAVVSGGWISTHEDITRQNDLEEQRDRSQKFLDQIVNNVPVAITVRDAVEFKYVLINQSAEDYFALPRNEIIGKTAYQLWSHEDADHIAKYDNDALQSVEALFVDEHSVQSAAKGKRFVTSKRVVIRDTVGAPQYMLAVLEDVTERKLANERIAHLAHYDALTDLPNRLLFREQLEQSVRWVKRGEKIAVLYLDLDQFKAVNDTLGHPVGDELLKVVASRLRSCLRETDIVARLGGDEFAIIQTDIAGPRDVIDLVTRIHRTIGETCDAGGHQLVVGTTIGIALSPGDGTDPDQLIRCADLALYGAKADGRGTYRFFESGMDARMKTRRDLESSLRTAVIGNELQLNYQPLVSLRSGNVVGCEALLRWRHPERGNISPADFIPIAEETGLIVPLGEWVVRTACAEAAKWPHDIKVAVNVSPLQFKSGNFLNVVVDALSVSGLPAARLELEITEAVQLYDDAPTRATLEQLRKLGVQIALDDFGTGFSSLSYLQRFPFDKIKIDRCFVSDVATSVESRSIVQAIVSIAATRHITTTAEGVETEQQKETLRLLGCTEMQGYLFSPARSGSEIAGLLAAPEKNETAA